MPRPSRYSPAEKAAILTSAREMLAAGVKRKDVAAHLEINLTSLIASIWSRKNINMAWNAVARSRLDAQIKQIIFNELRG
jgi:hypothetical protein